MPGRKPGRIGSSEQLSHPLRSAAERGAGDRRRRRGRAAAGGEEPAARRRMSDAVPSQALKAFASGPLAGTVAVPGDKSMSHRALILGALAGGETLVAGLLEGEDVLHTAAAIRAFGADARRLAPGRWWIEGPGRIK